MVVGQHELLQISREHQKLDRGPTVESHYPADIRSESSLNTSTTTAAAAATRNGLLQAFAHTAGTGAADGETIQQELAHSEDKNRKLLTTLAEMEVRKQQSILPSASALLD